MNPRRRRNSRFYKRRHRRNWWPWVVFVAVAALFFWAVFQFFSALFSSVTSESISVELEIQQGRSEFLLAEKSEWNPAFSEAKFLEGDAVRTTKNSRVILNFLDGNKLYLDSETEIEIVELTQKSSGKTNAVFQLNSGQIWAEIQDVSFQQDEDSSLVVETARSKTYVRGTTFNLNTNQETDTISLIEGQVSVDVLGENDKTQTVQVGVGQKLIVNEGTFDLLSRGGNAISAVEAGFTESDWYLDNLERTQPEAVAATRERLAPPPPPEPDSTEETDEAVTTSEFFDSLEVDDEIEAPTITSPVQGETIGAEVDLIPIRGTAPAEAFQIQVNDYVLQRFQPGDRIWTYIAAKEYGTLKPGSNTYNVVAITRDGKRSEITSINVTYEGTLDTPAPTTEDDTETPPPANAGLSAPVVTRPALFSVDPDAVYETSSTSLTLRGRVDTRTQYVEVNGYRLQRFSPGDTEFSYTAVYNAAGGGNMQEGENTYTIETFGPDGISAQTQAVIFFRPLSLE
jgi:hypothetical protein